MNSTMEKLSMCRICLWDVAPLCSIVNTNLHEIYEVLTKMPFVTEDSSPIQVCDFCCANLENSYELRRRCLQSEELFTQLLRSNVQVNLQIMPDRHLSLGDVVQMIPIEWDDVKMKQADAEESKGDKTSPVSEDVTAACSFIKVEIETDNEMPGSEDPSIGDDYFQSSDSADISLAIPNKEQSDVTAVKCTDDAAVKQDDTQQYHNALGLHTECDIPLDIVKEESDVDSGAAVFKKPPLTTQMNYEDTPANNLTRSDQTKNNMEELKSETKRTVEDKPVEKNKIVETREKLDIKLRNNKQNDSTSDHNDPHKEMSENKINANQSVNCSASNKLEQLSCDTCQKFFRCKSNLIRHIRTHTGEKPYKCNVCNKCFNHKDGLDIHMRVHTGEKHPYQCNICKKRFSKKGGLNYHMRTHTGEKPYRCNICKKCFSGKGSLDRHTRTHTGEKPYQCNICKNCFSEKSSLDRHARSHTGEKPYHCNVCKKSFNRKHNLYNHTRTHTGEKPYQCNICKNYFSKKSNLDRHTRTHTGENPYQCNICKNCFSDKSSLDRHTRTHTG